MIEMNSTSIKHHTDRPFDTLMERSVF